MRDALIAIILLLSLGSFSQEKNLLYLWPGNTSAETWPELAGRWLKDNTK
jgi:hypothetical protein